MLILCCRYISEDLRTQIYFYRSLFSQFTQSRQYTVTSTIDTWCHVIRSPQTQRDANIKDFYSNCLTRKCWYKNASNYTLFTKAQPSWPNTATESHWRTTAWVKKIPPPAACGFLTFFDKRLSILNQFFTHLLYVPIYATLQIFIQLTQTLTKLCHIKCDYLVHVICSKCPPSAEMHAFRLCKSRW